MGLADEVSLAIRSTGVDSRQDPTLALSAASIPGDTQGQAEVAAYALNQKAIGSAVEDYGHRSGGKGVLGATLGWLGGGVKGALHVVGHGVEAAGRIANAPLDQIKQQYRYLRDVQARHGYGAMLLDAIPMAAGGAAGFLAAGPWGIAAGTEVAGWAQERFSPSHRDSWERTASPDYVDPYGGQAISLGRDVARGLNALTKHVGIHIEQHKGFDLYDAVSGLGDGIYSVVADPLAGLGAVRKEMLAGEAVRGAVAARLATKWGGVAIKSDHLVQLAAENVPVKRALEHLATLDAGTIGARYRKLRPFARELGEADSWEKVGQVFKDKIDAAQMTQKVLPRRTLANAAFGDLYFDAKRRLGSLAFAGLEEVDEAGRTVLRAAEDQGRLTQLGQRAQRAVGKRVLSTTTYVPASFDDVAVELQKKRFFLNDPGSTGTIYDLAKWGHNENMARNVATEWAKASMPQRQVIYRNVMTDNIANLMELTEAGWSQTAEGSETLARVADQIDGMFGGVDAGHVTPWGFGPDGRSVSKVLVDGATESLPLLSHQRVEIPMPEYMKWRGNMKALANAGTSPFLAKADDFLYTHFTQNVFRRWALASGGFAIRAAAQDLVPYLMKAPHMLAEGMVVKQMAKRGWSVEPDEEQHIIASMTGFLARRLDVSQEDIDDLAEVIKANGAHIASPGVTAGWTGGIEVSGAEQYAKDQLHVLKGEVPKHQRLTSEVEAWKPGRKDYWQQWHKQAKDMAADPWTRAGAEEYRAALAEGASEAEATHRAVLKAKEALDTTDEETLNQFRRHFVSSQRDADILPGAAVATNQLEWVPGKAGKPGRWELTGEREYVGREAHQGEMFGTAERPETQWVPEVKGTPGRFEETGEVLEAGQWTAQPPLVNPAGNVPGGLREPGTQYSFGLEDAAGNPLTPSTTMYKEQRWVPGVEGKPGYFEYTGRTKEIPMEYSQGQILPGTWVEKERWIEGEAPELGFFRQTAPHAAGPQLVEQPRLFTEQIVDPHLDWAGSIVENMKGTITGQNGQLHDEVLAALAEGRGPDLAYMESVLEEAQPARILGAYEKPAAPTRLNNSIFRKLNAFINWAAREPIFQGEYLAARRELRESVAQGLLTHDEALQRATTRATMRMLPHIDNAAERTLMSEHARNFIPFYAAQQQAYARMWRLLQEDPAAFRRIQLAFTSMADFGGIYEDEGNNQHMILPGTGLFSAGFAKAASALGVPVIGSLPSAFSGSLKSLTSVSPFLEGDELIKVGPLVSLGARVLNNIMPETRAITDPVVGDIGAHQPVWEMLIPNSTMRNLTKTFIASDNRTQAKSVADAIQFLEFKQNVEMDKWVKAGKDPNDPEAPRFVPGPAATDMERAQFIDRVKNHARILGLAKSLLGAVAPVAPSTQVGDYGLKAELYDLIREKGITVAIQEFLEKNPDATPYTVFTTDAGTPSPIEATHPTQEWVRSNMGFLTDPRYSAGASYFVPQTDDAFSQEVYNEQLAMGLRRTKSPEQLIRDIETNQGNRWYFDVYKPARDAAMAKAASPRERRLISQQWSQQGGVNAAGEKVESLESRKLQSPIWYANFSSGGRDTQRQLAVQQMRAAFLDGAAPDTPMAEKIAALIENYDRHQTAMYPGRTDQLASALRKQEAASWQAYLKKTVEEEPDLTMVINNVFRGI